MENLKTKGYPNIAQSFGIAGIMIAASIVCTPLSFLSKSIGSELSTLIYYIATMGITFWTVYMIRLKRTNKRSFNLSVPNAKIIPVIMLTAILLLIGIASPITDSIPMPDYLKEIFLSLGDEKGVFSFLMLVIAAPIFEELIFRGIMLDGLLEKYSPTTSILISSILFGIVHLNPWQFVVAVIIGIFSGWIYYKTRSLTLAVIIHATVNLTGYISRFFVDESSIDENFLDLYGGVLNFVLITLASIAVICLCLLFLRKEFRKNTTSNPEEIEQDQTKIFDEY